MGQTTDIQWCDSTVNPTMGCDGCELWNAKVKTCYAGVLHGRYGGVNKGFSSKFEILTEYPGRMAKAAAWSDLVGTDRTDKPWLNGMPRVIFVSDMSDALSKAVSFEYLKREIIDIAYSPKGRRHIWMWLTKQAARMVGLSDWIRWKGIAWPTNLWPGTSITSSATKARIGHIVKVGDRTTTRFISAEPLHEDVGELDLAGIKLVIAGGGSGPDEPPCDTAWIRSVIQQSKIGGAATFVKQLGARPITSDVRDIPKREREHWEEKGRGGAPFAEWEESVHELKLKDSHGGDMSEWPEDIRVRQFPKSSVMPAPAGSGVGR